MKFPEFDFNQMNETDVREEILSPLLRELGYQSGTSNNIIREQLLRYPQAQMGKEKPDKDPPLKGKADYICVVDNSIQWVIEAKSPNVDLTVTEINQAYTYANHPEVRAVYFCVSNGKIFNIYQTTQGTNAGPILSKTYNELPEAVSIIDNILGPLAIRRDFPVHPPDVGMPVGPGLRSGARITSSFIYFTYNSLNDKALSELTLSIKNGVVDRNEIGQLAAYLNTEAPFQSMQKLNEKLGLADFEIFNKEEVVSTEK
jgi:hypothetical protein